MTSFQAASNSLATTAVVIPVYMAPHIDPTAHCEALTDTVTGFLSTGILPQHLCLSVDGGTSEPIETLAKLRDLALTVAPRNRGKLAALRHGVGILQADPDWQTLAVVDQDGDHFANDLITMLRMATHLRHGNPDRRFLVLGERLSRHRPMGFLRGELEELADRVLLDALTYRAATTGKPLALEHALTLSEFPDFHSGYKMFDRATAHDVFLTEPQRCDAGDAAYYRHAVEAVMTVEALEAGAVLAGVSRRTINQQAFSTFGVMDRCRLVADKMIWPLRRLDIPPDFVTQWVANHLGRLLLNTLAPDGIDELRKIAIATLTACGGEASAVERFESPPFV